MNLNRDELLIVNHVGLIVLFPALPCLFFGLPFLTVAIGSTLLGHLFQNWPTILAGVVIGVPMTYFGVGFLTYAQCTLLDREKRSGESWTRLIHRWQPETFKLNDESNISVWRPQRGTSLVRRYRAMLKTTKGYIKLSEHLSRDRVMNHANEAGAFMKIPVLEEASD